MYKFLCNKAYGKIAKISTIVMILLTITVIFSDFMGLVLPKSSPLAPINDIFGLVIALLYLLFFIIAGILYVLWFRRAYRNVALVVTTKLEWASWWTIGGWIIPIACLFVPYKIMRDLYQQTASVLNAPVNVSYVKQWWTFYVISMFASNASFKASLLAKTPQELKMASAVAMVSGFIDLIALLFSLKVINDYRKMEAELYELSLKKAS